MSQKYPQANSASSIPGTSKKSTIKIDGYSSATLWANRKRKRLDAESRDKIYRGLSIQDRISLAQSRRGNSSKEVARLKKLQQAEKPKKETTSKVKK